MKKLAMWMGLIIFCVIASPAFGQQTAEEYFDKGVELYEAQNYNESLAAFEKAIEIKPDYAEAYYDLSIVYWQQKQYKKVLENLQKVIEIAPDSDVAKKAERDIKKLKSAGISLAVFEAEGKATYPTTGPSQKPTATLQELIADLQFGSVNKRIAAAKGLGFFAEEEAVKALGEVIKNSGELPEIRMAAVESLGQIALPSAIPFLQAALEAPDFPAEGKPAAIKALSVINTTESLKVILLAWAGTFPGGLSDQNVVDLVWKKGIEEFADIIRPAYLQITGERKIYMALALGILKDATGVPLMVSRLKENYPDDAALNPSLNQTLMPGAPPGMPEEVGNPSAISILKQTPGAGSWSRADETLLRIEIVEVLGICAGANQEPFLIYLSKNDQEGKVREAALEAVKNLEVRIARSVEDYQKGIALVKNGKIAEGIPFIQLALKENPDAPYAQEIKQIQARYNYDQAIILLAANKKDEAIALFQSALTLDPEAPFRKDAEDKLTALQAPFIPSGVVNMPPGMPAANMPPGMPAANMPPGMPAGGRTSGTPLGLPGVPAGWATY
jgi:tetratricopeptide (TPR) repeat protein